MKRCLGPKTIFLPPGCDCSARSDNWPRELFTVPYQRPIAGVEIQTAAVTMEAQSTVHIYISVTGETVEKPPATMSPTMSRLRSVRELRLGLNCRIVLRELAALNKERLIPAKAKK